jgi:hypothetical protein
MPDCFVAWFITDEPFVHPVLLHARMVAERDKALEVTKMVYEQGEKIANVHGIHRSIYTGTYAAYIALMDNCIFAVRSNKG